jgi:hypothetical protein
MSKLYKEEQPLPMHHSTAWRKKPLTALLLLIFSTPLFAQAFQIDSDQITLEEQFCPLVTSLEQDPNKNTWSGPDHWYSLNPSFLRTLTRFVGAQWIGVGVGRIICTYANDNQSSFFVDLQRNNLVSMPIGGLWSKDKGGYKDCFASDVKQCGYSAIKRAVPKDIYEQIDFHNKSPSQTPKTK